jgi:hypothetical protein
MDWPEVFLHDPAARAGDLKSDTLSVTLSYRAIEILAGWPATPPTAKTIRTAWMWLNGALRGQGVTVVPGPTREAHRAAAVALSGLPWITMYFKPPGRLKTQEQKGHIRKALEAVTKVQFEVVKGVPDPTRPIYVWVKVFGGMSVKPDLLSLTLITPQLALEDLFGPGLPQDLAADISLYLRLPGWRIGGNDQPIALDSNPELVRVFVPMADAEQYAGQIPAMAWPNNPAAPLRLPDGLRAHYAQEPGELRQDLDTSRPQ